MRLLLILLAASLAFVIACNGDDGGEATPAPTSTAGLAATATSEPEPAASPTPGVPDTIASDEIELVDGFTAYEIASEFFRPTSIAIAPDGTLYVSERHDGVYQLRDNNGDGVFEDKVRFLPSSNSAGEYDEITGLVVAGDGRVYVGDRGRVTVADDLDGDGVADSITPIITGLPVGRHQNDGLVFGPDGMLYIAHGSTCDDCVEGNPLSASILRANPDGSGVELYASGIRNSYDIAFDGQGRLWATDNGSDGMEAPFCASVDELNLIEQGADYGWPYAPECDPYNDGVAPVASLGLHTGSTGIDVYDGSQFPVEYNGDLFLTLWGSFAFEAEFAAELYTFTPGDDAIQPFSSGLQRPIDVLTDHDGSLLVLDYGLGTLFRIVYSG